MAQATHYDAMFEAVRELDTLITRLENYDATANVEGVTTLVTITQLEIQSYIYSLAARMKKVRLDMPIHLPRIT